MEAIDNKDSETARGLHLQGLYSFRGRARAACEMKRKPEIQACLNAARSTMRTQLAVRAWLATTAYVYLARSIAR